MEWYVKSSPIHYCLGLDLFVEVIINSSLQNSLNVVTSTYDYVYTSLHHNIMYRYISYLTMGIA